MQSKTIAVITMIVGLLIFLGAFWVLPLLIMLKMAIGGFMLSAGLLLISAGLGKLYSICG